MKFSYSRIFTRPLTCASIGLLALSAAPLPAQNEAASEAEVYIMSPFEVETAGDRGYHASNAISGSRVSVAIQDMPLTIEVVTSEFIEDTGSTDLRDSLRYSAGILLETQNTAFAGSQAVDNIGGINNPEGATADKSNTSFKIRGFLTNNTLRNGYRRQHSTDTVNIDRVEVIRGPSALLYGVGNFGGVVNYLTKKPLPEFQQTISAGIGSYDWRRISIDSTGPIGEMFGYRLTAAYEVNDDWTDLNNSEHWFVSPVFEIKPFKGTNIVLDIEYGEGRDEAISFKSVRTPTQPIDPSQGDRFTTFGFLEFEDKDVRTFRWSGPDTFLETESFNFNATLTQQIFEGLNLLAGYNYSKVKYDSRDVGATMVILAPNSTSEAAAFADTIFARQIIDGTSNDVVVPVENAVLQYGWNGGEEDIDWNQVRVELNYQKTTFEDSKWLRMEHGLLLGYSYEQRMFDTIRSQSDGIMYKNPTDSSYIRWGTRSDGTPDVPFGPFSLNGGVAENRGAYAVYNGRLLDNRVFLVAGIREDTTTNKDNYNEVIGSRAGRTFTPDGELSQTTQQYGISVKIIDGFSVFALQSEGIEPNFSGFVDGNGEPLNSALATANEFGVKLDLFDGMIAATLSAFKIEREGVPFQYWWAPAPAVGRFRPEDDIIYRLQEFNPDVLTSNAYLAQARDEFDAARASGAIYDKQTADRRNTFTYVNASTPEGAAYLDAVFDALKAEFAKPIDQRTDLDPWAGWLFAGAEPNIDDPEVNTAAEDISSYGDLPYSQSIADKSEGFEAQIFFTPNDQFQLVFTYSHVKKEIIDPGFFVSYPYAEGNWDRWTPWYFPNANWGLGGVDTAIAYPGGPSPNLPSQDTADWSGVGWGVGESLDDTPEHVITWWSTYKFKENFLEGLQLGFGGSWESEREYASAFTSAGQKKENTTETEIQAFTDPRLTLNMMVKYEWSMDDAFDAHVQFNADNFLNDTDQYGLLYAPGVSWRLNFGITF